MRASTFAATFLNVQHKTPNARVEPYLRDLTATADVFAGAETNNREAVVAGLEGFTAYHAPRPFTPARALPLLARTEVFDWRAFGSEWLSDGDDVGHGGAGPAKMGAKWATVVRLVHKPSGRPCTFITLHGTPSVQLGGKRDELSEAQIRRAVRLARIAHVRGPVIVWGDMNVTPGHPNAEPFHRAGMRLLNSDEPTHGHRTIDHMWALGDVGCEGFEVGVPLVPGDHRPITAHLRLD